MKIMLVQFSDIHLRSDEKRNAVLRRAESIAHAVVGLPEEVNAYIVVMSGDTAYSGRQIEYEQATVLLKSIFGAIRAEVVAKPFAFVIIPGNHDCNFSAADSTRRVLLENLKPKDLVDTNPISHCLQVQRDFTEFANSLAVHLPDVEIVSLTDWFAMRTILIDGIPVTFNLLNSAWCSQLKEKPGSLLFPVDLLRNASATVADSELVISVLHHPYNWYSPENARDLRSALDQRSDLILTGHEHDSGAYGKQTSRGEQTEYLEGGVLQDSDNDNNSTFNAVVIDTDEQIQSHHFFRWNNGSYESERSAVERPFQRNKRRLAGSFPLSSEFGVRIADPGVALNHPRKDRLTLPDFFIYPDLKEIAFEDAQETAFVRSDDVVKHLVKAERVLIIGPDTSGKTALAKRLMVDLKSSGFVPLFIDGGTLNLRDPSKVGRALSTCISQQYGSSQVQAYEQLSKDKRAVIVDDYHLMNLNEHGKAKFLEYLFDRYKIVIVLAGDESRFEELTRQRDDRAALIQLKHLEILELGYTLRSKMIRNWHSLGTEFTATKEETDAKVSKTERQINTLLGEQFMPAYPLFVLIALQQLEIQQSISTTAGSIGHLYEFLIKRSLLRSITGQTNADTNENYLSELAWKMFESGVTRVNDEECRRWHEEYCRVYQLRFDYIQQQSALCRAELIDEQAGSVSFKYPYLYYYFVANYLASHSTLPAIQLRIRVLTTYLHQTMAANIVLFLCHLSKNPIILESVIETADQLFSNYAPCDLEADVTFLDTFVGDLSGLTLDGDDPEHRRQALLEDADRATRAEKITHGTDNHSLSRVEIRCDMQQLNDQLQLNGAIKTIQIIGQILRNHVGSLRGEIKKQLVSRCYSLGLRAMKCLFAVLEENIAELVDALVKALQRKQGGVPKPGSRNSDKKEDKNRLRQRINKSVWGTLELGTYAIIKYIGESVGSENLSETFAEVLSNERTMPLELIDLAVKLDNYRGFPETETIKLANRLHKNAFTFSVLRVSAHDRQVTRAIASRGGTRGEREQVYCWRERYCCNWRRRARRVAFASAR